MSQEVGQPGFDHAGYVNITTSDHVVHGQVKQSGSFSFVRIYERCVNPQFYDHLNCYLPFRIVDMKYHSTSPSSLWKSLSDRSRHWISLRENVRSTVSIGPLVRPSQGTARDVGLYNSRPHPQAQPTTHSQVLQTHQLRGSEF